MKLLPRTKTAYRYLLSYAGIALLSCSLVGIVLFYMAVGEMRAAQRDTQEERLQIAADMLEGNLALMQETALRIQFLSYFKPSYLLQNGYHAYQMLDYLSRFQNTVPLCDEYFLMYQDTDLVYKVGDVKGSNRFSVYADHALGIVDADALYHQINAVDRYTVLPLEEAGATLLAFPVELSKWTTDRAVLCYVLRTNRLHQQIGAAIGELDGDLSVSIGEVPVTGVSVRSDDPVLSVFSKEDSVKLVLEPNIDSQYERLDNYRRFSYGFIAFVTGLMVLLAVLVAKRSYRPIREMANRYAPGVPRGDDLQQISAVMGELFEQNRVSAQQLEDKIDNLARQRQIIRRQLVQLILCGQFEHQTQHLLQDLDPYARERLFSVIVVQPQSADVSVFESLLPLVENLSDDNLIFHGNVLRNARSAAFFCLCSDAGDMDDVCDLVEAVCAEHGIQVRCGVGMICDSLSRVPVSLLDALSALQDPESNPAPEGGRSGDLWLKRLLTEVENANLEHALRLWSRLEEQILSYSYLTQICSFSEIVNDLMQLAKRHDLHIMEERIHMFAVLQDPESFNALIRSLIERICRELGNQSKERDATLCQAILTYIQDNVQDYQMSLANLSDIFSIPVKQVSRLVRESTGLSYKDYLKEVRVERACRLLTQENLSVSETCVQVGLTEVSYFIRLFKSVTGETPANYRQRQKPFLETSDQKRGIS